MKVSTFICYKYIYAVKHTKLAYVPIFPKKQFTVKIRQPITIFMENEIEKKIFYPKELCYTEIPKDDLVENMLVYIKKTIPEWEEIKVDKIDNSQFS